MLIKFTVENWLSFRDSVSFSMIASRERQHGERVPKLQKFRARVLPIALIYGGNAAGKSNLFLAINFARRLVVDGTQPDKPIGVKPFRLDSERIKQPSSFQFEILAGETLYEFSFSADRKRILEEKLVQIKSTSERVLYHRLGGEPNFDVELAEDEHLKFAFKGTRDNQLFLTNSISQNLDVFRPVYDWFNVSLSLITPTSSFAPLHDFVEEGNQLASVLNGVLSQLDTGVRCLSVQDIPIADIHLSEEDQSMLESDIQEGEAALAMHGITNERINISRRSGELVAKRLRTRHEKSDGTIVEFHMHDESDGTQRAIDLLPAFLDVSAHDSTSVYIIDELDRSLHSVLTRQLLSAYLSNCSPSSRAQLIATTHDLLLMDQKLLRRDEMWAAERNFAGVSSLFSFSEYEDVRFDKDLRKSYLKGRLGGIPRILLDGSSMALSDSDKVEASEDNAQAT